jgi:geranyl-CoA carboxylase alpha subunit
MDYEFLSGGEAHRVSLETKDGSPAAVVKGHRLEMEALRVSPHSVSLLVGGRSYLVRWARDGKKLFLAVGAGRFCLEEPDREGEPAGFKGPAKAKGEDTVKAPMPGQVIKVFVAEGGRVNAGDSLVVVEAMKMEHEMRAAFAATVEKVHVKAGQQVDAFQPLVQLKPAEEAG